MQYIEAIFLTNFGICAALLALGIVLDHILFKRLKKSHTAYYRAIGEPMIIASVNLTDEGFVQLLRGGMYAYPLVFRGIPEKFPKDAKLRKLAQSIRIVFTILLVLLIPMVIVGYSFFKSTP
jgi:ABC-type sulfate transport system permease subunit